jgi:hypothetical protein
VVSVDVDDAELRDVWRTTGRASIRPAVRAYGTTTAGMANLQRRWAYGL